MSEPLRRRYHCNLKIAVSLGVVSAERTGGIPASTLHRFRNTDSSVTHHGDRFRVIPCLKRNCEKGRGKRGFWPLEKVQSFALE